MQLRSLLVLSALALSAPAAAQPAQPSPPAQPTDPGEVAYQEGRKAYDLREWDTAIEKFKEAYRLRSDAPSLFNIAQSYRLKGDCVEALGFYKTYKRNFPTAPNIDAVDKFIAELEPCAKEKTAGQPPTGGGQTSQQPVQPETKPEAMKAPPPAPPVEDGGKSKRVAGLVVGVRVCCSSRPDSRSACSRRPRLMTSPTAVICRIRPRSIHPSRTAASATTCSPRSRGASEARRLSEARCFTCWAAARNSRESARCPSVAVPCSRGDSPGKAHRDRRRIDGGRLLSSLCPRLQARTV